MFLGFYWYIPSFKCGFKYNQGTGANVIKLFMDAIYEFS
jgi:hypothetical protein